MARVCLHYRGFWHLRFPCSYFDRCGRIDDVIVLKSAEKIVPIQQEALITSNSMVKGAVMFGRGRDEAGVIIDPAPEYAFDPKDESLLIAFRNKIWYGKRKPE